MKNFTLSLYAYHLRHTLSESPGDVVADANLLWENLAKLGEGSLPFIGLKDLRSKLICYQNDKYEPKREIVRKTEWLTDIGVLDLGSLPTKEGFRISANLQPFLLNDTYSVDLTLFPESPNQWIDVRQLHHFQTSSLFPSNIQASLGQTLWIYGEVEPSENCDELADKFAVALFADTNLNPVRTNQDKLFGSPLFEYEVTDPSEPDHPNRKCQILIIINNTQDITVPLAENTYDWLLYLLCFHHKILYIYHQASQRYKEARAIYSYLEKTIQGFNHQIPISDLQTLLVETLQKNSIILDVYKIYKYI